MKNYNKNYPPYEVEKFVSFREMLRNAADATGERLAFRYLRGGEVVDVTYREFRDMTLALGEAMTERGWNGAHIAVVSENSFPFVLSFLTVLQSAGVFVPLDKELPPEDKCNVLADSDSTVVLFSEKYAGQIEQMRDRLPGVRAWVAIDAPEDSADGKTLSFARLLECGYNLRAQGKNRFFSIDRPRDALALLVYTSGTTGMAKGVMLSERNLCCAVYYGLQTSAVHGTLLSVLPYNHTYEAVALLASLHSHATICINDNLRHVLKNMVRFRPDDIYLVPAFAELFYKKIWANARAEGKEETLRRAIRTSNRLRRMGIDARRTMFASVHAAFGGNLIKIICGGAPIRPEIGQFFDDIGILLINGYGITECSPLVSANRDFFNDPATVGVPLLCCEIRIDDPDDEGNGEICVRGDVVMLGYYKHPELTAQVLEPDGWFHTGDLGRMNDKGQLLITGRKKNLIVLSNGKNIYPEEIEMRIAQIVYISEVVVYAQKDEHGNETALCAAVYCQPDFSEGKSVEELTACLKTDIAAACDALPDYKRVARVVVRDHPFIKTTTNKIKRNCIDR